MNWDAWIGMAAMFVLLIVSLGLLMVILGLISIPKRSNIDIQPKKLNRGDVVKFEIDDSMIIEQIELLEEKIDLNEELNIGYNNKARYLDEKCRMTYNEQDINAMQIEAAKYRLMANKIVNENNRMMQEREKLIYTHGKPIQVMKR